MSFILDALKKSEHERQRQATPGLVESGPVRMRPRLPPWAIGLYVLLGITVLLLLFVVTRSLLGSPPFAAAPTPRTPARAAADTPRASRDDPGTAEDVTSAEDAAGVSNAAARDANRARAAAAHGQPFSPLDSSPTYAPEIPVTAADGPTLTPAPTAVRSQPGSAAVGQNARRRAAANEDYKPSDAEVLPSINELNLTGTQALPELHLDVHVFATNAADRFVFINMRKYHEGAVLQEGPTLERIRRDGVILDYNGVRFLLPRQ